MRLLVLVGIVVILILAAWFFGAWRLAKTLYLIARVTPYEQTIVGAPKILVFGDSTGYGTGATKGADSIAGLLGVDFPQYSIVNHSKNGRTIGEALVAIKKIPTAERYALILLQIGGNDILQKRPPDAVRSELSELFAISLEHSDHVIMVTSGNVGAAAAYVGTKEADVYEQLTRHYREMVMPMAVESGVTYIDLFEEPGVDLFLREPTVYLASDGLHPSSAGYAYWYTKVQPVVVKKLAARQPEQ